MASILTDVSIWLSAHAGIGFAAYLAAGFFLMAGLGMFRRMR